MEELKSLLNIPYCITFLCVTEIVLRLIWAKPKSEAMSVVKKPSPALAAIRSIPSVFIALFTGAVIGLVFYNLNAVQANDNSVMERLIVSYAVTTSMYELAWKWVMKMAAKQFG
jgi:hypothetical protein